MKSVGASVYTSAMLISTAQRLRRGAALCAACLSLSACGQTGYLYLVNPPTKFPALTRQPPPVPSTTAVPQAACVLIPVPGSIVAPVAAPFPGVSLEQVPYAEPQPGPYEAAPSSLTDILPACLSLPQKTPAPTAATHTNTDHQ